MNNKKGMTMVEVIVAFSILLMLMAMLTTCVKMASKMQIYAREQRNAVYEVEKDLYNDNVTKESQGDIKFTFTQSNNKKNQFELSGTLIKKSVNEKVFYDIVSGNSTNGGGE